jgi:hypothetical protein
LPLRPGRVLPRMIAIFNSLTAVLSGGRWFTFEPSSEHKGGNLKVQVSLT